MYDIVTTPSTPVDNDAGVRLMTHPSGGSVLMLDPAATAALATFLDNLPLTHDLVSDGYDLAGVDVVKAIHGMFRVAGLT